MARLQCPDGKDGLQIRQAAENISIEVAIVDGWWTDWDLQLRRFAGNNLSSLIVTEGRSEGKIV
jgi:hypothetical protein